MVTNTKKVIKVYTGLGEALLTLDNILNVERREASLFLLYKDSNVIEVKCMDSLQARNCFNDIEIELLAFSLRSN